MKLIPRQTTVESSAKFFGLEQGSSTGSMTSILFDIPEGMDGAELRQAKLVEKERLDIEVLTMEFARGACTRAVYEERKTTIRSIYNKLLKREAVTDG